jgi:hypothetical protein
MEVSEQALLLMKSSHQRKAANLAPAFGETIGRLPELCTEENSTEREWRLPAVEPATASKQSAR